MSPNQLLSIVIQSFPMLLIDDSEQLQAILYRGLSVYQSKFGSRQLTVLNIDLESGLSSSLPSDYLQRACLTDGLGNGYFSQVVVIAGEKKLKVDLDKRFKPPANLLYFVDLAGSDYDDYQLPPESLSILQDYLELLIRIPNNEIKSALAARNEIVDPSVEDNASLLTRKKELEIEMITSAPPLPLVSFS